MKLYGKLGKVVWAVDPFLEDIRFFRHSAKIIKNIIKENSQVQVEAAYVLVPKEVDSMGYSLNIFSMADYEKGAESTLKKLLKMVKLDQEVKITFVENEGASTRTAVGALAEYVGKSKADLVVIDSHARKGVKRFFLGSFAESFVNQSPVPVLISNPKEKISARFNHVVYPTDFSRDSHIGFLNLLNQMKGKKGKILLFHQISDSSMHVPAGGGFVVSGNYVPETSLFEQAEKHRRKCIAKWNQEAKDAGVKMKTVIKSRRNFPDIADSIVKAAKKHRANLIVMGAESGPVMTALLGSVARRVVRYSPIPVMTVHLNKDQDASLSQPT